MKKPKYSLNAAGEFIIENYNFAKPFANFFPGIAGKYGIPMWAFYVNRGQAISSFGIKDKDHALLEFFPANKAWQFSSLLGFRTFIKINQGKKILLYEPFHNGPANSVFELSNRMKITSYALEIEEENLTLGLKIKVRYFTIPDDSYAGLARVVTFQNISKSARTFEILDGLPQIIPYGTNNFFLKNMSRTIEAWMTVDNLGKGVPFYRLFTDPSDRPEVVHISEGNFYLGFHFDKNKPCVIRPVIDPRYIFGEVTDFSYPLYFSGRKKFSYPKKELTCSQTPCAFLFSSLKLSAGAEKSIYAVSGYMRTLGALNLAVKKIIAPGYLMRKMRENREVIGQLQSGINTASGSREFDLYARQTYLDNIMRGGYPLTLKYDSKKAPAFYLYSRKHGDAERDYNRFYLEPSYYSQGNGNYRDMNQNRRNDVWFNPDIQDENIIAFFNLLQADGFNPLVIKGASFSLKDSVAFKKGLSEVVGPAGLQKILEFLKSPFTPGEIIIFIQEQKIKLKVDYDKFLAVLLAHSAQVQDAEHGEGFWTDHWAYNLDLLESFLGVYPERLKEIVFDKRAFTFYDNIEIVKPRKEKYTLKDGRVWQLHSLNADPRKREMIAGRKLFPHIARKGYGEGEIYQTSLINKLLCLFVNKLASLDAQGAGIEMEANKPNWFDALNGLPALFGSSCCETFELKRLIIFIKEALRKTGVKEIDITGEIYEFLAGLAGLLKEYLLDNSADRDFTFWDKAYALKELYRQKTKLGFCGEEAKTDTQELVSILDNALKKVDAGLAKTQRAKNIYCGYFINEVTKYEPLPGNFVRPKKFAQKKLPLFLEPFMHALRISESQKESKAIHAAVRASALFDKKLKMYKVTESLKAAPEEIGRCRIFTPGWLENESIWLHMEYKYLLELLKHGLNKEFYDDFRNTLIPFQDPKRYGRSILENSSFLVSSAFPDKCLHGNGFVARLSGSTAEFINIWLVMNLGTAPFFLGARNELNLCFRPILAGWLFDRKGNYSFNFLSKIKVIYHNPKRKDTFSSSGVRVKKISFRDKDASPVEILSDTIPAPFAEQVRSRQITGIDIFLE